MIKHLNFQFNALAHVRIVVLHIRRLFLCSVEVDMNNVNQPSDDYTNVVINGSWNNWSGWGVELEDNDNDGIWTGIESGWF